MDEPKTCKDFGERPGCLGVADSRYTMYFDDIGEPPIHWCRACGPDVHAVDKMLRGALATQPGFAKQLEAAIDAVTKNKADA